jgi:hypothetical protein
MQEISPALAETNGCASDGQGIDAQPASPGFECWIQDTPFAAHAICRHS